MHASTPSTQRPLLSWLLLQGVACALHGQATGSEHHLALARESFEAVGSSPTEVDTVRGGAGGSWGEACGC